jgi:hypothetical protein
VVMNRHFWHKQTPAGFTDLTKSGHVVELCIYSFEHSAKDETQVRADVEKAAAIWCQGGINVQASHWERLGPLAPSEPLDLSSHALAEQIPCGGNLSDQARDQLYELGRPNCPGNSFESIAVYYIPRSHFQGSSGSGCHQWRTQGTDGKPEHIILLTDEADGRVLAHEIGHALFLRETGSNVWINDDPDPSMDPNNTGHNTSPQNVMFPSVSQNPVVSSEQASQARRSRLVRLKDLAFGFTDNKPFKLGVKMKTLHVDWTSDELFSDDALESTWKFRVKTGIEDDTKVHTDSRFGSGDHALPASLDYPLLEVASDTDELQIEVTGEDWDFWSPNDALPKLEKKWTKGQDLWGSGSSTPTGAPLGEHKEGPKENGDIKYSLTYNVRVDERPIEETFRSSNDIC